MPRRARRRIGCHPKCLMFKPRGIPGRELEHVVLKLQEIEAMRLVDLEGLTQEEAAEKMGVSRKTLWMDLKSGRRKVVDALVNGKAILIEGIDAP
ncbi:MAG: DUF134 domain-containing protein [Archaeoglobi archaeon]|nr:DUF134 domain-containing protein [Candidatus Mnemosynella sp.]MBC7115148.1 DUF134 domain-containing protein [Candidatus Mnemosynella bozhongmuii]